MSYSSAQEQFAALRVDTEAALATLARTPISIHCWQGDDVGGFEGPRALDGGIAVTGNYPGKAVTIDQLRSDFEKVLALLPGKHRINLHASYADLQGRKVDRTDLSIADFQSWVDWCQSLGIGMDFNPTYFGHPKAADGLTLSHPDAGLREYWIEHGKACRRIAAEAGRQLGKPVVNNVWIPDGSKDLPFDRKAPRERLAASLDALFAEPIEESLQIDAVESKLFGIGAESYTVGSHEFYLAYAITRQKALCLDAGHFHPTESVADKISSVLQFVPRLLLHVSRGVRWDSDHVVLLDDPTLAIAQELVRGGFLDRTAIGLDFFDASINRIAAWVIGTRNIQKALLIALLEPADLMREAEAAGDFSHRLALMEAAKALPWGMVWDEFCRRQDAPGEFDWMAEVKAYETAVLSRRGG